MYNSCVFNTVKYNSTCIRQVTPPEPEVSGGARLRRRKQKVLIRQFFDIVGLKLISNKQLFYLLGFICIAEKYGYPINAQVLHQIQTDLIVSGKEIHSITLQKELIGFKQFLKSEQIDIHSLKLFLSNQNYKLNGMKLIDAISYQVLHGNKSFYDEQDKLIYGEKDITAILEALDLLDFEE